MCLELVITIFPIPLKRHNSEGFETSTAISQSINAIIMSYLFAFTAQTVGSKIMSTHKQRWQKSNAFRGSCTNRASAIEFMWMITESFYKLHWMTQNVQCACNPCTHFFVELAAQILTQHTVSVLPSNWQSKRSGHLKTAHVMYYWRKTGGKREREKKRGGYKHGCTQRHFTLHLTAGYRHSKPCF